jgi:hypothetical protein
MKILELLTEGRTGSLQDDVADALPATYVFPDLQTLTTNIDLEWPLPLQKD